MTWVRSRRLDDMTVNRNWALGLVPVVLVLAGLEIAMALGRTAPVPFLALYAATAAGATLGGWRAGIGAGIVSSIHVLHGHLVGFGPPPLTGTIWNVALGIALYCGTGWILGRLRDQREAGMAALERHRQRLQADLRAEAEAKRRSQGDVITHEALLGAAVRIAGLGYFVLNAKTSDCEVCSDRHAAHFGIDPQTFMRQTRGDAPPLDFVHPDDRAHVRRHLGLVRQGATAQFDFRGRHRDGHEVRIREIVEPVTDTEGRLIKAIGISMDMTEAHRTEAHLREVQKIEAIGNLTAGVAHDFNNLLAVILGNLELAAETADEAERREMLDAAAGAARRGAELTGLLLSFGRKAMLNPRPLDLCATIALLGGLFRRTLPANIDLKLPGVAGECVALLDRAQFESAVLNLVVNARDAMPDGGALTLDGEHVRVDGQEPDLELEPGDYIAIAVTDTGTGMTDEVRSRALEPFFSTKGVGKGTGLGLPMVLGFARQSGGDLHIASTPGKGTVMRMYFPVATLDPDAPAPADEPAQAPQSGGQTVLLVEDDAQVRQVTARQLAALGYRVEVADSGQAALDILRDRPDVEILLSDVVMPGGMQGPDLVARARDMRPGLRAVLMSGYHAGIADGDGDEGGSLDDVPRLTKPVSRRDLGACLARVAGGTG